MKNIPVDDFRVREGDRVRLSRRPTRIEPLYASKKEYKTALEQQVAALSDLQQLFYAADSKSLLLIFQAMDAAGKDGTIKHVMSGVNPQGCQVASFKQPSAGELQHDFLWRSVRELPERGRIGIFNRSYYEDVLIARVHPELLKAESLDEQAGKKKDFWRRRYRSIVDLERHLHRNGTQVLKFYLHLSPEEQALRFIARIDDPAKNWKLSAADLEERGFWDQYMRAYEDCINATSSDHAPWHVVPADDKETTRLIVSQVIVETLQAMKMSYPQASPERRQELQSMRQQLVA